MKTKIIVSCMVMCVLILIGIQVNAALEVTGSATCKDSVEPGETITLNLNLNVTSVSQGVEAIIATIDYPSEVMEMSIGTIPGIDVISSGDLLTITPDEVITSGSKTIAKLNFKVNDDTTETEATIKLTELEVLDGDGTQKDLADITKTVKIGGTAEEKTLESIKITKPSVTNIEFGKKYDISEMKVIATFSDGTTKDITSTCNYYFDDVKVETLNGIELQVGKHTIKATYEGKEDSFIITVIESSSSDGGEIGGDDETGDETRAPTDISETGLEMITIPGIIISIIIAVVSYKKYRIF